MSGRHVNRVIFGPCTLAIPLCLWGLPAAAQTQNQNQNQTGSASLGARSNLLANMGGLRTTVGDYGITLGVTDTETLLGNVSGGVKQGATMQGVTTATLAIDTQKAFGLPGGTIHVSALQIHGRSLSPYYLDNLQTANGTEAEPTANLTILAGVFDDNPPGGPFDDDPQSADAGGVRFNLNTGALFIAEAQLHVNTIANLPGIYKLGFWYDTAYFPDQAFDNQGLSLANPTSNGIPAMHKGNYSVYGVVDQTIWQPKGSARSVNVFARLMGAPTAQNLITFSANFGLTVTDPLPGRPNDTAGIHIGVVKVSGRAAELDRATGLYSGAFVPVRGSETSIELTYQAQVTPWLQVQPDAQFIANPGGGLMNPADPTTRLHNEVVVGVRTNVIF
jgi:carbohydrate-selective porin OprB